MHITNKLNLPANIVRMAERAFHKKGDYSVTELEKSPREFWLIARHTDEIYVDIVDMLYMLDGTVWHKFVQEGAAPNQLVEEYLTMEVNGKTLSGTPDLLEGKKLSDWKNTSVFTMIYKSRMESWAAQVNAYRLLFLKYGFEINELEIIAKFRDWQRSKARYDDSYPQHGAAVIPMPLWPIERTEKYINDRVALLEAHKNTPDSDLPECTADERWQSETVFKCMKGNNKKSSKNFKKSKDNITEGQLGYITEKDAKEAAQKYCEEKKLTLLEVKGESRKCSDYCYACQFCSQFLAGSPPPVNDFEATLNAAKQKFALPEASIDMLLEDK